MALPSMEMATLSHQTARAPSCIHRQFLTRRLRTLRRPVAHRHTRPTCRTYSTTIASPTFFSNCSVNLDAIAARIPSLPPLASLPSLLQELWDSVLRAVPKKKPSKSKSKMKRNAGNKGGKAYKDVENLCRCSACGRVKRMHVLCPYCVASKLAGC